MLYISCFYVVYYKCLFLQHKETDAAAKALERRWSELESRNNKLAEQVNTTKQVACWLKWQYASSARRSVDPLGPLELILFSLNKNYDVSGEFLILVLTVLVVFTVIIWSIG